MRVHRYVLGRVVGGAFVKSGMAKNADARETKKNTSICERFCPTKLGGFDR